MADDHEPRTGGVAVTRRYVVGFLGIEGYAYYETRQPGPADGLTIIVGDEHGTWFPLAEVEALIDRDTRDNEWAEAITAVFPWEIDGDEDVMGCVVNHVSNLASLYEEMIDPNDPAVRERRTRGTWTPCSPPFGVRSERVPGLRGDHPRPLGRPGQLVSADEARRIGEEMLAARWDGVSKEDEKYVQALIRVDMHGGEPPQWVRDDLAREAAAYAARHAGRDDGAGSS